MVTSMKWYLEKMAIAFTTAPLRTLLSTCVRTKLMPYNIYLSASLSLQSKGEEEDEEEEEDDDDEEEEEDHLDSSICFSFLLRIKYVQSVERL